jgi:hypothetical protein
MKRSLCVLAASLTLCAASAALAAPAAPVEAPFGCKATAPNVCYFRIFYAPRGGRVIALPAGNTEKVPGVTAGRDRYCMTLNKAPTSNCARKLVSAGSNS